MSKSIKIVMGVVGLIAILAFGYWYATSGGSTAPTSTLSSSAPAAGSAGSSLSPTDTAINDKFLNLLLNMRTIRLDQAIFADPAFVSLRDFSTQIAPDTNPGRINPFAPIGQDAQAQAAIVATTAQASQVTKTSAVIIGAVPAGVSVQRAYFEYGTTSAIPLPNSTTSVGVNPATGIWGFTLNALTPGTTYYARAVAVVNNAPLYGAVVSWKTPTQ